MKRIRPGKSECITVMDATVTLSKAAFEILGCLEGVEVYAGKGSTAVKLESDFIFSFPSLGK